jgi:hypothetical protein
MAFNAIMSTTRNFSGGWEAARKFTEKLTSDPFKNIFYRLT